MLFPYPAARFFAAKRIFVHCFQYSKHIFWGHEKLEPFQLDTEITAEEVNYLLRASRIVTASVHAFTSIIPLSANIISTAASWGAHMLSHTLCKKVLYFYL